METYRCNWHQVFFESGKALYLDGRNLDDDDAEFIAAELASDIMLEKLSLCENKIGGTGARALTEDLKTNSTLKILYLNMNQIDDGGGIAFASVLEMNSTLQEIDLSSNQIGNAGAAKIMEALKKNPGLKIYLAKNSNIDDATSAAIDSLVKMNYKDRFALSIQHQLAQNIDTIDCLVFPVPCCTVESWKASCLGESLQTNTCVSSLKIPLEAEWQNSELGMDGNLCPLLKYIEESRVLSSLQYVVRSSNVDCSEAVF